MDAPATAAVTPPQTIRRADYRPPDWLVPHVALDFALDASRTTVTAQLDVVRNGDHDRPLVLDWDSPDAPLAVLVDGQPVTPQPRPGAILVPLAGDAHRVETIVAIAPDTNTQLMGLYASDSLLCTQCEAEGFRRITPFPDRPDVLARYTVRLTADRTLYPVLLANGDRAGAGTLADGRHWAEWHDPFPKPSYLFALVAGDLACNADRFTTASGRDVALGIWVRAADLDRTHHAMAALKAAMGWDERVYGREYDLSEFNIVAVADFNFGAMENKGLNIFNSRYVLADPDTATDVDYDNVAAVVAHEYFHNWSGNRVTCRDWFQLSLKEGFTVYRDQEFSADQGSRAVKRIEDVRTLRAAQFPEDAGPLAHPIRPESFIEISNFYTATVYNKGAEVIRMLALLLGAGPFRAGCDLYFARHDGTAATCEDFVVAMEDASGVDLSRFRRWYEQAGTPRLTARLETEGNTTRLSLRQSLPATPGAAVAPPLPIPVALALFDRATGAKLADWLEVLDEGERVLVFDDLGATPVLSINRGFSAPVIVDAGRSAADLALLSAHDDDPFARYEAMQQLMIDTLVAAVAQAGGDGASGAVDPAPVIAAVARTLADPALDPAFVAEAVMLPGEAQLGDAMAVVDPAAIRAARERLRAAIGATLLDEWRRLFALHDGSADEDFALNPAAKGSRRLRGVALAYLAAGGAADAGALAGTAFRTARTMTERQAALQVLANGDWPERGEALAAFHDRYHDNALVLDKWFATQAASLRPDTPAVVEALARHPAFTLANPNRARALIGSFAANQAAFHDPSGRGYRFVADQLLALDRINPQTAAKLVPPLGRWRRFAAEPAARMRAELERMLATPGLSRDVYEQVSKSLG